MDEKVKKKGCLHTGDVPRLYLINMWTLRPWRIFLRCACTILLFVITTPPNTPTRTHTLLHLHLQNSAWSCWPHHWASVHTRSLSAVWRGSAQGQHHSLKGFRRGMVDCWTRGQRRVAASSEEVSLFIIEGEKRKELGDVAGERKVEASLLV